MCRRFDGFVDERALTRTTLNLPGTGKPSYLFAGKRKDLKRIFDTNFNSDLSQNCTEKLIMPSKTKINLLFNDI